MITFASNGTGWDDDAGAPYPGGMTDTQIAPITAALDATGQPWQVTRWPEPGTVNVYLATASIYEDRLIVGPRTVMMCHGIADKHYRTAYRGGMQKFAHVIVPGPAHAAAARGLPGVTMLGYPKLDPLINGQIPRIPAGDRIRVLWAPTHGGGGEAKPLQSGETKRVAARRSTWWNRDEILPLLDAYDVTVAPHPRHAPGRRATLHSYAAADVVIADGGSTLYEAMILGLPVVVCDWLTRDAIARRNTLERKLYRSGALHHASSPETLAATVEKAAADGPLPAAAVFAENVLPVRLRGRGGQLHADFLLALATDPVLIEREARLMAAKSLHDPTAERQRAERAERRAAYIARRAGVEPAPASAPASAAAPAETDADAVSGPGPADAPADADAGGSGRQTPPADDAGETGAVERPADRDRVDVWRGYAAARGVDVDGMTKAEIIAAVG